jgi:hypothetical protein
MKQRCRRQAAAAAQKQCEARRDEKEGLHTREASGLVGSEAHHGDDSPGRLEAAIHMPSSAVAQRNAQSTSACSAWVAAVGAQEGLWAREPLMPAGQSSDGEGGSG